MGGGLRLPPTSDPVVACARAGMTVELSGGALVAMVVANIIGMVVGARITERKGRGRLPGLLLGLVLGLPGALVALILPARTGDSGASARRQPLPERTATSAPPPTDGIGTGDAILGVDHVAVTVPPGREFDTRRFYSGLLGLEEIDKPALLAARGGCWFAAGSQQLHVSADGEGFAPAVRAHPALRVVDPETLQALAERLQAAGYDVAWAAVGEIPGLERFHTHDPFGNRLELVAATRAAPHVAP